MPLTITVGSMTLTPAMDPWLRVADASMRLTASRDRLHDALERSWLDWTPTWTHLPGTDEPFTPLDGDWGWLVAHPDAIGMSGFAWTTPDAFARRLMSCGETEDAAYCRTMVMHVCAHLIHRHPRAWAWALLALRPERFCASAHPRLDANPLLADLSAFMIPSVFDGIGGPRFAFALADAARSNRWRTPNVNAPDGTMIRIPGRVWTGLERMNLHYLFDGPDF